MTAQEINQTYNAMYAELKAKQDADEQICSDWYARFSEMARLDYEANGALYA